MTRDSGGDEDPQVVSSQGMKFSKYRMLAALVGIVLLLASVPILLRALEISANARDEVIASVPDTQCRDENYYWSCVNNWVATWSGNLLLSGLLALLLALVGSTLVVLGAPTVIRWLLGMGIVFAAFALFFCPIAASLTSASNSLYFINGSHDPGRTNGVKEQAHLWIMIIVVNLIGAAITFYLIVKSMIGRSDEVAHEKASSLFQNSKKGEVAALRFHASRLRSNGHSSDADLIAERAVEVESLTLASSRTAYGPSDFRGAINLRESLDQAAKTEKAGRPEDAAMIYEQIGLLETAGHLRRSKRLIVEQRNITIDINRLVDQLRSGGLSVMYNCPSCRAPVDLASAIERSGSGIVCTYCGSVFNTVEVERFLRNLARD